MKGSFSRRPPRIELFQSICPFYFVTFNTRHRNPVLDNADVHEAFLISCRRAHEEHGVAVGRYVFMPDHIHFFLMLPESGIRLTRWVASLKNVLGKTLRRRGVAHPCWQEGFFDHVLRSAESYGQKWEYVRQNPVRAGLCVSPDEWTWQGEIIRIAF